MTLLLRDDSDSVVAGAFGAARATAETVMPAAIGVAIGAAVCVPVRDEARRLPALLLALAAQRGLRERFAVCLLFDGPQPASARRARQLARGAAFDLYLESIPRRAAPNAGRARRAALELGQRLVGADPAHCLLTTDADSVPRPDWVAANIAALTQVDVVAGHIRRQRAPRMAWRSRLEDYLERLYRLERRIDPIDYEAPGAPPSLGGASLGFRSSVYHTLGGFPALARAEDVALVMAARRAGYRFARDARVQVMTSSRLHGRAPGGLAAELCRGVGDDTPLARVEHPAHAAQRYCQHAGIRQAYRCRDTDTTQAHLAVTLGLSRQQVHAAACHAASADAFTLALAPIGTGPRVTLETAEHILADLEHDVVGYCA